MVTMSAERLADVLGGTIVRGDADVVFSGVEIDTREIAPGMAFFALPGEKSDGHAWVGAAARAGARVAVVSRFDDQVTTGLPSTPLTVVQVEDCAEALRALARHHRSNLRCPVVGVTGSTGKTSTKDFLVAALGNGGRVVATKGNRNNELGVPLTVLRAAPRTSVLIVEMGMRGLGQIAELCEIARPTMGVVTNIGQTHMELLGSQDAIAQAKGELVECIPADGRVFLNGDDPWSRKLKSRSAAPITWYGLGKRCNVRATDIETDDMGRPVLTLRASRRAARVALPVPGRHHAYTAVAAAAVALALGATLSEIAEGLANVVPTAMRMEAFISASGITVVNDAYNASPTSMRAAVTALADMQTPGKRIAVLGDMAELGSLTDLAHFRLGEAVADSGIEQLVTVGARARRIAEAALAKGMDPSSVRPCVTVEEASEVLDDLLSPRDIVLVKASRSMGLERVVEGILEPHV